MMHGWANFDASWEAIENESTHFALEDFYEPLVSKQILFGSMNGSGKLAFQGFGGLLKLLCALSLEEY